MSKDAHEPLLVFRRMLDLQNLPDWMKDNWFIHDGEIISFEQGGYRPHPLEERVCKPLFWIHQ
jgi:hypothetical protein